ncbi:PDZ domain-containing protein [Fulvivirgaceae bacterium BMA10]|uniref:PDZ domain-containing protein n=1 Tax=Splendidivirga corallicola TaxID=3051826 RepID=A0ABT8L104_9BACT|nr:PDZ domain-containing protein [Fulvivirgaceae bacterium BMA10]
MDYKKTLVLTLTLIAISWRYFTYISLDQIGTIGIETDSNQIITHVAKGSPADRAGILAGDEILSVKGIKPDERPGNNQPIEYNIRRNDTDITISLVSAEASRDQVTMTRILGIMGMIILIVGLITFFQTRNTLSFIFFLYCFTMGFHWGYFPSVVSMQVQNVLTSVYLFISIFTGSFILHFALLFPEPRKSAKKMYLIYAPGIIGIVFFMATLFHKYLIPAFYLSEFILSTLYTIMGYIILIRTYVKTLSNKRKQLGLTIIFWGILVSNIPYILSNILPFMNFGDDIGTQPYSLFFIVGPVAFAIGIRRLVDNQRI